MQQTSLMFSEAASASCLVADQRRANAVAYAAIRDSLQARSVQSVLTLGRGSSDNAATFARYIIERRAGLATGSMAPSVTSLYGAKLDLSSTLLLAISQSGRSPDLLGAARQARAQGAQVVAIVNDMDSPLAEEASFAIDIAAGPERSVAATKSFMLSLTAILDLVAAIAGDGHLVSLLQELPQQLDRAWALDWSQAVEKLNGSNSLFVIARGHSLGIAQEFALKLKETCSIHAEAYSAAEVRHGPMALVGEGFPVIMLGQEDESLADIEALACQFLDRGAFVIGAGINIESSITLPTISSDPVVAPLLQLQSFYKLCEELSRSRGFDPDRPPHLSKVTRTL